MTHAFTMDDWYRAGGRKHVTGSLNITSYTASGETPTPSNFNLRRIDSITAMGPSDEGYVFRWDGTKVRANSGDASDGSVTVTDGVAYRTQLWTDILGGEDAAQSLGTNTTAAVNGAYVHALAAADGAAVSTGITNPDYPRSLVIQIASAGGGALPADMGNVVVNGTDQFGNTIQETISLTALNGVTLSAGAEVWAIGTKVFATVTDYDGSIDITATLADAEMSVGVGTRLGLLSELDTPTAGDVKSVRKNDAKVGSGTYNVSTTTHSVKMGASLADNDDIVIEYAIDADTASGALTGSILSNTEASGATDVGAAKVVAVGI